MDCYIYVLQKKTKPEIFGAIRFVYPYTKFQVEETNGGPEGMVMYAVTDKDCAVKVLSSCENKDEWHVVSCLIFTPVTQ